MSEGVPIPQPHFIYERENKHISTYLVELLRGNDPIEIKFIKKYMAYCQYNVMFFMFSFK